MCPLLGNFKLLKINFVIPEDGCFLSKFDADPCTDGGDPLNQKVQTDGWMERRLFGFI